MSIKEIEDKPSLKLTRFCGEEIFPIVEAVWYINEEENELNSLWLEIHAGIGTTCEDTNDEEVEPVWQLTYNAENLNEKDLQAGYKIEIPDGDEDVSDNVTNFYYFEHEPTHNNTIEILGRKDKKLLIRIVGEVTDVNYYDGSKPDNKISVETWFEYGLSKL